ncbi:hypothetical protein Cgig2_000265 [Carnegiea gigantea]|uniref:Aminotransferase-like plant mobile domain-containing protein n=1 Tax=Carnegiea gigantea TaxID=171969 RepID=A0A9Q1GG00_9CARY|nr:hypothetical protein Cgig2_000265 [Carnegiea gigantea]
MGELNVTAEGELAAFLAFWLSRFVLPHDKEVIKPETFAMAAFMASGQRISLTPIILSYIYHGLREAASHLDHPGKANTICPIHYIIGWLAELFPSLYHCRPDSDFPSLVYYAGLLGSKHSLPQARHVFRDGSYLPLRASSYPEDSHNGRDVIDIGLPDEEFKFLLSIWSSVLLDLLASRAGVSQSLSELHSMIDIYKLSTIEIYWLFSKIEEIFGVVETAVKIADIVDVDRVKVLSDQDLTYSYKIAHIEDQRNNLSNKASKLKVNEQEVLREEERIHKM